MKNCLGNIEKTGRAFVVGGSKTFASNPEWDME
jgi:hypothetical protein